MGTSFHNSNSLYTACFQSYSSYGQRAGHMHMPLYLNEDDTLESALDNLNNVILKLMPAKKGIRILDIGCGRGELACLLAKKINAQVIGISSSHHEIDVAQKRAIELKISDKCRFIVTDMNKLSVDNIGFFDVILTIESECYFLSIQHAINTILSLLVANGSWITARISLFENIHSSSSKSLAKKIISGWKTAPITTDTSFHTSAAQQYLTNESRSYSENIVNYWHKLAPIPLNSVLLVKLRFMIKSISESKKMSDWKTVYNHRMAFFYLIVGLERKYFDYRLHRLSK